MTLNPGTNEAIDKTSSKGKERSKRTPKKNKDFKGTPIKLKTDVQNVLPVVTDNQRNRSIPLGLENNSKVCFFNYVVQALFFLPSRSC